jgi:hypothetical protein
MRESRALGESDRRRKSTKRSCGARCGRATGRGDRQRAAHDRRDRGEAHRCRARANTQRRRSTGKETLNALDFARTVWGSARAWNTITKADIRAFGRARVEQLRAQAARRARRRRAHVQRVLTVAQWLRDEEHDRRRRVRAPKNWKEELRGYWLDASAAELPAPHRPRYTIEEAFAIIEAAAPIDPRLELMLWLAPNQRLEASRARASIERGSRARRVCGFPRAERSAARLSR